MRTVREVDGYRQIEEFLVWQPSVLLTISDQIETIAQWDCPVIIRGESGTAKESVARQIHLCSKRSSKAFVPTNCAVLRGQLFRSQLFGQAGEASQGGKGAVLGAFRAADGGTLFLDEIDKLSLDLQHELLQVIQDRSIQPVGAIERYPVDVRLICATTVELRGLVEEGAFLSELFYSLNVARLELPPLRQRRDDIVILAKYFLDLCAKSYDEKPKKLLPSAIRVLVRYHWPGNVRELANVIERAFLNSNSDEIGASDLPSEIVTAELTDERQDGDGEFPGFDEVNKKLIIRALEKTRGQKMAAARLLKIDHRKLNRLIKKFDIEVSDYKN